MTIHNLMEELVGKILKEMLASRPEWSSLDSARVDDIMAIALNKLPPRYTTTRKGEVIVKSQIRSQLESDIYRELSEAITIVLQAPDRK